MVLIGDINTMLHLFKYLLLLSFSIVISLSASALPTGSSGKLFTLHGSNTLGAKLAPSWAAAWLTNEDVKEVEIFALSANNEYRVQGSFEGRTVYIDILAHGSSTGFKALQVGSTDIALSSREIKQKEKLTLQKLGDMRSFDAEHVVAIDGLAVIVHPSNPVNALSVNKIAQIFSGKITHWSALGGENRPISVYARDSNSGTWDTFKNLVLSSAYTLAPNASRFESNDELSERVSSNRGAIGFVGQASIHQSKALGVSSGENTSALKPEVVYVATEDYPLARRLFMYTPVQIENSLVKDFIDFAKNKQGQDIVNTIGFVSQNPITLKVKNTAGPKTYLELSEYAQRLSVNFRFKAEESKLDNKAQQDVLRVMHYTQSVKGPLKVQLVGFSNPRENNSHADILSRLRASAVKIALFKKGIVSEKVLGYGADVLVASTEGEQSNKNDRVEVWVYREADRIAFEK